ncbi:MAG: substrate-binding domain-containing protein [Candidatus Sulfotelmatobacter sp.]
MKRLNFLVSLTNNDNDYQQEQAAAAEKAARRLGVEVKIIHANNDAVSQSQQLLEHVQSASGRPDAILFEPAGGTAFPQVARAAAAAGIGWVVLNHEVDYILELRRLYKVPVFAITSDHQEVGKIQGQQFGALLPTGGKLLYIEGPANSSAARERTAGMMRTKPANIQIKSMRGNWTEESAYKAVSSWLRLRTSQESHIDLVGAQDDSMAIGARKAFSEIAEADRARWMKIPITGCDGMPKTGQAWVRSGTLAATIFIRPNTDLAIEMLVEAFKGAMLPESKTTAPESVPSLAELSVLAGKLAKSAKV